MKKIKATISKPTISTLKFQRKSDFNKLLKFVEKETKECGLTSAENLLNNLI